MIYNFILIIFFLFAMASYYIKRDEQKNYILIFESIILILFIGLRWEIGTDWDSYYQFFTKSNYIDNEIFEVGYVILNKFIRGFTSNYTVFLLIFCSFFYFVLYKTIIKFSINPLLSFFIFYFTFISSIGTNRQLLAIAFCLLSIPFIFKRDLIKFSCTILLACCFHLSAFLFFFTYFLVKHINGKNLLLILVGIIFLRFLNIPSYIESLMPYVGTLAEYKLGATIKSANENSMINIILGLIRKLIWIILAFYSYPLVKNKKYFDYFFNISLIGIAVYFIFNNTIFQLFVARLALYFNIGDIFIIPYAFLLFKGKNRIIALFILLLYAYIIMEKNLSATLTTLGYDIFRPYKSILF